MLAFKCTNLEIEMTSLLALYRPLVA